ncbi:MAG: 2-C-methyl-D-erythritol 4-phosphate cytidylyltransferase [Sedimentisphaerales bacterium]|nr:2-C-methyl-D-erythritol 4-phosphate cytidylyltransferase [Sedimentisphaerales bacterium]
MSSKIAVIICAAGPASRFGGKRKKQFVDVAGRAVFLRSLEVFANRDDVKQILLGIAQDDEEIVSIKWGANLKFFNVKLFYGGYERFDTINKGLKLVKDDMDLIAVHDASRCCLTAELTDKVITAAAKSGAAIPACPVAATIKEVRDGIIIRTVDRSALYEAQTPQIFEAKLLKKAYENLKNVDEKKISDDSQLVEAMGHKVTIVESDSSNIKITRQSDIAIAEAIIKSRPEPKREGPIGPYAEAQW